MPEYGWVNFLSEAETLRRASDLVAKGEIKNAIALLEQSLLSRSCSEKIREVLAGLHARSGQAKKAREHKDAMVDSSMVHGSDDDLPDETDFAYLEAKSSQLEEAEYHFDQTITQQKPSPGPTLRLKTSSQSESAEFADDANIRYKKREVVAPPPTREEHSAESKYIDPADSPSTQNNQSVSNTNNELHSEPDSVASEHSESSTLETDAHDSKNNARKTLMLKSARQPVADNDRREVRVVYKAKSEKEASANAEVDNAQVPLTSQPGADSAQETTPELPEPHHGEPLDAENITTLPDVVEPNSESTITPLQSQAIDDADPQWEKDDFEFLNDYVDEQELQDEVTSAGEPQKIVPDDDSEEHFLFDDNEADLFDFWDDESDELEEDSENTSALENQLSREERARVVAVECILDFDWHTKTLPFLIEVFSTPGWSSTRRALEREVKAGATFDELDLAFAVKRLWQDSSRYWITFSKAWASGESADATYRHCSWKQALHLVRLFEQLPTLDEVYDLLEREFEYWYHNRILRLCFPAFNKYLFLYRLNRRNETSLFSAFDLPEEHDGLEAEWLSQPHSNPMEKLNALGVDLIEQYTTKSYYASDLYTNEYMLELYKRSGKSGKGDTE
ncbi:hypothetical protein [Salinimonas iocasae]|uniref:Uncharacterized protein n=1 Tax=Salinimonas iocasae TaxID=2572577 RepID=A0A5B7YF91_9ALTE|nr:hypothetical protein [Salinimonas iocasae]QCZ94367.1 hypothetical protein FBQ74_13215 [Salinimonas iocasae]